MSADKLDSFARMLVACLKSPNSECMNRSDWSAVCYTLQRNPIAEIRSDRTVGSGLDSEVHCEVKQPSVHGSIRVGKDIQLIVGFVHVGVCIGWSEQVGLNVDKSIAERNNVVGKILPVRLLNVGHVVERFLRQELNVCT